MAVPQSTSHSVRIDGQTFGARDGGDVAHGAARGVDDVAQRRAAALVVGGGPRVGELADLARRAALHVEGDEVEGRARAAGAVVLAGGAMLQELPEDGVPGTGGAAAADLRRRQRVLHGRRRVVVGLQELLRRGQPVEAQVRLVPEVPVPLRDDILAVALRLVPHHRVHQVVPPVVVARRVAVGLLPRLGQLRLRRQVGVRRSASDRAGRRAEPLRHEAEAEERDALRPHDDVHDLVHQREVIRALTIDARRLVDADAVVEYAHGAAQQRGLADALQRPLQPHARAQQVVGHVAHDGVRQRGHVSGLLGAADGASDGRHVCELPLSKRARKSCRRATAGSPRRAGWKPASSAAILAGLAAWHLPPERSIRARQAAATRP